MYYVRQFSICWRQQGSVLLTFAVSLSQQPSFMSIKAIKRLGMWMEISRNYHITVRDDFISPDSLICSYFLFGFSHLLLFFSSCSWIHLKFLQSIKWNFKILYCQMIIPYFLWFLIAHIYTLLCVSVWKMRSCSRMSSRYLCFFVLYFFKPMPWCPPTLASLLLTPPLLPAQAFCQQHVF